MNEQPRPAAAEQAAAEIMTEAIRPRATLIVNPYSSGLTARRERVIVQTLDEYVELDIRRTERAGHANELAAEAVRDDVDIVIACGGDGTANEVVNGMDVGNDTADERPMFTLIPAGATNVFTRALGLVNDPIKATTQLATAIVGKRATPVNLGRFDERVFLFAAGVGLDGGTVKRIEAKRSGRRPGDIAHLNTVIGMFVSEGLVMNERLKVTVDDTGEVLDAAMLMCANIDPFSYVGKLPLHLLPHARLEGGLDVMAPKKVSMFFATRYGLSSFAQQRRLVKDDKVQMRCDIEGFTIAADDPQPCQVDGEYIGDRTNMRVELLRNALRLVY